MFTHGANQRGVVTSFASHSLSTVTR